MVGAVVVAVLLTAVFLAVVLMQARVRLEARQVRIWVAGIFATTIPYHSIDEVTPWKSTGITAGMGLRVLPHGATGYLVGPELAHFSGLSGLVALDRLVSGGGGADLTH